MSEHVKQLPEYHNLTAETADIFRSFEARLTEPSKANADRIEKLEEQAHYANGVADLAMKHRNYAEQRVKNLEAALAHIYAWYPISTFNPHQTIKEIKAFARKALEGKDGKA